MPESINKEEHKKGILLILQKRHLKEHKFKIEKKREKGKAINSRVQKQKEFNGE